ncbi:MAG: hypothetical protein NZ700_01200 [Gemmataceae bacterium]|nr:hypothetical protein [Gemmataceae bacterium]MDW8265658.1 hypothetical protein [Gemmataceae bacterium]
MAYVYADASQLTASLRQPANLAKVRIAYRDTLHEQLRALSKQSRWADAIRLWQHLHERRLLSPELCLDAASCLRHLKKPQDALAVLQEAFETYAASVSADWLEQCGDLALQLGKEGEPLAEKAFKKASERLLYIKTSAPAVP